MFYEEKMIDGVLHWRGTPTGDWQPVSPRELAEKIDILRTRLAESEARAVADARRLDWLVGQTRLIDLYNMVAQYCDCPMPTTPALARAAIDAAIDAAQEAEREAASAATRC